MAARTNASWRTHAKRAYRSGLEVAVGALLATAGIAAQYEAFKVPYTVPESIHAYTPDWLLPNGIILETKGLWELDDRRKHLLVREQHPDLDIRMVFSNANAKLRKGSPTSYSMFCDKHGILWAHKVPRKEWLTEPVNVASKGAVEALMQRTS